jgi:hypothetical protein
MILEAIILVVALVVLVDYFAFIRQLQPYEAEQTKASHGAFMIAVCLWFFSYRQDLQLERGFAVLFGAGVAGLGALGVFWLTLGVSRTQFYRLDARHVVRSIVKMMVGPGLVHAVHYYTQDWSYDFKWYRDRIGIIVIYWCLITGATKLILVLRGVRETDSGTPGAPHGNAGFTDGQGLK